MEVLGAIASGMTIAGLVKLCLSAFEVIELSRAQCQDFEKLALQLNIERARLFTWAQTMGLGRDATDATDQPPQVEHGASRSAKPPKLIRQQEPREGNLVTDDQDLLQQSPFQDLVRDTLMIILRIFEDTDKLQKKYGCTISRHCNEERGRKSKPLGLTEAVRNLSDVFSGFLISRQRPVEDYRLKQRAKWIIKDRERFADLIKDLRDLINGLQDITKSLVTVARQEGILRYNIQQIKDPDTLSMISEVCQQEYPDISDAASIKVEILTLETERRRNIETWITTVADGLDFTEKLDLEQMTITELKALLRQRMEGREQGVLRDSQTRSPSAKDDNMSLISREMASSLLLSELSNPELASSTQLQKVNDFKQLFEILHSEARFLGEREKLIRLNNIYIRAHYQTSDY